MNHDVEITECETLEDFAGCVKLQREVFALPDVELSPVRHFVVTKNAGGFTLGAYVEGKLAGFTLSVPAFHRAERAFYSHMTGVRPEYQSLGIGAKLKWTQRSRALAEGVQYIKWTFEPIKARNAYFNLEKLGAVVREYRPNFYGIDYATSPESGQGIGLASDRLFAEWHLESPKVKALAAGEKFFEAREANAEIAIMNDWFALVAVHPEIALAEQTRIRSEFQNAFSSGKTVFGFRRDDANPTYLLY